MTPPTGQEADLVPLLVVSLEAILQGNQLINQQNQLRHTF